MKWQEGPRKRAFFYVPQCLPAVRLAFAIIGNYPLFAGLMAEPVRHPYFPFIDGLRAIAVLSVVLYHLHGSYLPGGFAGVDIFFVISGFVVTASVAMRSASALPAFVLYFLSRRLLRIAPALMVCLIATALVSALVIPDAWLSASNQTTGRYAFFGFSNLILAQNANAYFSPITEFNAYTHTWSLGVEEQFYLLFPLLFWGWTRAPRWRPLVLAAFAIIGGASLTYAFFERPLDPLRAFYLLPSRFWELAMGALLYQLLALSRKENDIEVAGQARAWRTIGAAVSLCLVFYGLIRGSPEAFPAPGAILPVLGTVGVLGFLLGVPAGSPVVALLTWSPLRFFGRISYSLYLWHWPVFVMFRWTFGLETLPNQFAALAIALLLAVLSWAYVENPVRRSSRARTAPRWAIVILGFVVLYGGYSTARYIDRHQSRWSISTVARHADDWYPDKGQAKSSPDGCHAAVAEISAVGEGMRASYQRTGCTKPVDGPAVFAIGDSHAMAFASMFSGYTLLTGAPVHLYNDGGCPFLSLQPAREADAHCQASAKAAIADMVSKIKPGDVVFLPSLRMPRRVDQWVRYSDEQVQQQLSSPEAVAGRAEAIRTGSDVLQSLRARGAAVLVEAPNINWNSPTFRCADPWTRTNPICAGGSTVDRNEFLQLRQPVLDGVEKLAGSVQGGAVFDPVPTLCPNGAVCSAYREGRPLFFDGDHVSAYGNSLLLPGFVDAVRKAGQGVH